MQVIIYGPNNLRLCFLCVSVLFCFYTACKPPNFLSIHLHLIMSVCVCAGSQCLDWALGPTHTSALLPTLSTPCLRSSGGNAFSAWGREMSCAARRNLSGPGPKKSLRFATFTESQLLANRDFHV